MIYRKLGSSSLTVSAFAFGAWQIGDAAYWGDNGSSNGDSAVHAALDAGITLFDTAEMYGSGKSEEALGRALGRRRDDVLITSKVLPQNCAPSLLRSACEESLRRLGTDRIDLYQVHWPPRDVPFCDVYGELARLRSEGKIREIGVSNFGAIDLAEWSRVGHCVSDQLGYNLLFRVPEREILPACAAGNIGVLVYMPLLQGILSGRWKSVEEIPPLRRRTRHFSCEREGTRHGEPGCEEILLATLRELDDIAGGLGQSPASVSLAWLLAQPAVSSVIVGARDAAQLRRNLTAVDLVLQPDTLRRLDAATAGLKLHFGTNADMWQGVHAGRIR